MEYANIMQPERPMIAIFKGWMDSQTSNEQISNVGYPRTSLFADKKTRTGKRRDKKRQFEFVNAAPDRIKDPSVRRLVKKHVRNQFLRDNSDKLSESSTSSRPSNNSSHLNTPPRRCRPEEPKTGKPSDEETISQDLQDCSGIPNSVGYPTALCAFSYAIEMQPRFHALLSHYLTFASRRGYPRRLRLKPNPLSSPNWFKFAVTDAAMLHAMLYSGAVYLALLEGRNESKDSIYHLGQTVSIVNNRLRKSLENIEDSTVGALSCLALGAAITGSQETWHVHMRGLKQIIRLRGQSCLGEMGQLLLTKLQRTDIAGAIDYSETPYLYFKRSDDPPVWSTIPHQILRSTERETRRILSDCLVCPILISTVTNVGYFSKALFAAELDSSILYDPARLSKDTYWIHYRLLSSQTSSPNASEERDIDRACRMGALLYMKCLLDEFPHSATGASILLKRLQESLQRVTILKPTTPLLLWLSIIGAALSKSDMRLWFVGFLAKTIVKTSITSFLDRELEMSKLLSLEQVLGSSVEKLWEDVSEAVRTGMTIQHV